MMLEARALVSIADHALCSLGSHRPSAGEREAQPD